MLVDAYDTLMLTNQRLCAGTGVGVQRGLCSELVVRYDIASIHRSIAPAQPARQRQQCCQLHPLLRRRAEIPPCLPADVLPSGVLRGRQRDPDWRHSRPAVDTGCWGPLRQADDAA